MTTMTNEDILKKVLENSGIKKHKELKIIEDKYVNFETSKSQRKMRDCYSINELDNWTNYDFGLYVKKKHFEKTKNYLNQSSISIHRDILVAKDSISDLIGFCNNLVLYDYINYFFAHQYDYIVRKYNSFYTKQLTYDNVIAAFCDMYDYTLSVNKFYNNISRPEKIEKEIKEANNYLNMQVRMNQLYSLSEEELIKNYGIVLTINFLIYKKNLAKMNAIEYIIELCKKIDKNNGLNEVINTTLKHSPYPEWFEFKNVNRLLSYVDKNLSIAITFKNNVPVYDFLKGN